MIRLALGTLRRHRGAYLGTFLAALLAVALLASGGLLLFSVLTTQPPADRFGAATAMVSGDREITLTITKEKKDKVKHKTKSERLTGAGTLPTDLAGRVAALPGVAAAVPDAAFPVLLATGDNRPVRGADDAPVIGHGWASAALTPFALRDGTAPGPGEVVLDADLAARAAVQPGDPVQITSRTGVHTLRLSGVAAPAGRDGLPAQGALFLADAQVREISGLPGPTAVAVVAAPGADHSALLAKLRTEVGDAPVLSGDDKVRADLPSALPDYIGPISIFGFVIGITAFAAIFVLTGTVALGGRQRLRELALLRTVGATPGLLRRLLGVESVLVALLAAVPGCPIGVVLANLVAARFRELGAVPAQFTVRTNVGVLLAAVGAGVLVVFLSARIAGRRAARIAPTQALAETATAPGGGRNGRLLLAIPPAGAAIAVLTFVPMGGPLGMGMGFVSCALLLCAVAAAGPVLVRPLAAGAARLVGAAGVTGWLAGMVSRAETRRVTAVAVPLTLMFAINATMLLNSTLSTKLASEEQALRTAPAAAQVTAPGGLPLGTVERIAALPGVTGTAAVLPTRVVLNEGGKPEDHPAQGLFDAGTERALDLGVRQGALAGEGTFAASDDLADARSWRAGDNVDMWLADGEPVTLRLSAIYERSRGFGDVVLPARLVAAHDPRGLAAMVALRGDDVTARVRAALPALTVVPDSAAASAGDAQDQQAAWELLVLISLGFTAIAVVNTFAIAAGARRREYADLRLAGATAGQVWRMATREAVIVVAVGLLMGAAVTAIVVGAFSTAQDGRFRLIVDAGTYLGMLGGVGLLGLLAGSVPTRLVLRRGSLPTIAEGR
ncbi:ABC transporter permease [Micromonospora arborensis]|uniref:ABC transporter permease n=1 Tax=Micromonospora arborensis TaxID=2116518 RepID=UPI0034072777